MIGEAEMLSKAEREKGYRPVPQLRPEEVAVLRRVSRGALLRTNRENKPPLFTYEDGTAMTRLSRDGEREEEAVYRMVKHGWLIPIEGETLIEGCAAQRYRARTAQDGPTPKFIRK